MCYASPGARACEHSVASAEAVFHNLCRLLENIHQVSTLFRTLHCGCAMRRLGQGPVSTALLRQKLSSIICVDCLKIFTRSLHCLGLYIVDVLCVAVDSICVVRFGAFSISSNRYALCLSALVSQVSADKQCGLELFFLVVCFPEPTAVQNKKGWQHPEVFPGGPPPQY